MLARRARPPSRGGPQITCAALFWAFPISSSTISSSAPSARFAPEAHGHYQIRLDIEGTPTLRTVLDITHPEDPFFMPTAGAAIRAIPEVVAADPGHLTAGVFGSWSPRLRAPVQIET